MSSGITTQDADSLYAFELFRDGTAGLVYLMKDRIGDVGELLRALWAVVVAGDSVLDPKVVEGLVARRQRLSGSLLDTLTKRELEVLGEMAQGKSTGAVADACFISQSAVEKHINSIFSKLGLAQSESEAHRQVAAVLTLLRDYGDNLPAPE